MFISFLFKEVNIPQLLPAGYKKTGTNFRNGADEVDSTHPSMAGSCGSMWGGELPKKSFTYYLF